MPNKRINMRKIRDILRLRFEAGLSFRQISQCADVSTCAIQKMLKRLDAVGVSWPLPEGMSESRLASLLYPESDSRPGELRILDAPALSALPAAPYEYAEYRAVKVAPDYHVEYARHWYSVPHELVDQPLSLKAGQTVIQIWHQGQCVAQHPRSQHEYKHTTNPLHMPVQHQKHSGSTPERLLAMGKNIGAYTGKVVESLLKRKAHPEQAYRAVLGLIALQKKYGRERLEKARHVAWHHKTPDRRFIENLLRHQRENQELQAMRGGKTHPAASLEHENLRGPDYYH